MIEQIKILVMNRFFTMLGAIALLFVSSCSKYDDSNLWDSVHALEERMIQLEQLCKQMNTNISSLQTIVTAVQTFDYVTGVTPIIQDGQEIGYTISFTKSNPITIYHGKDGEKGEAGATGNNGDTPVIGVRQDTDGIYYWTLNGNWLTDGANKIKAQGTDGSNGASAYELALQKGYTGTLEEWLESLKGANGQSAYEQAVEKGYIGTLDEWLEDLQGASGQDGTPGTPGEDGTPGKDGITPKLKIEDGYWYVSYDNEQTWEILGKATGEDGADGADGAPGQDGQPGKDGDPMFQSVTQDEYNVYFTLTNGEEITLPKKPTLAIHFTGELSLSFQVNETKTVQYTISGGSANNVVKAEMLNEDGGYTLRTVPASTTTGRIEISSKIPTVNRVIVSVSDGSHTIMAAIDVFGQPTLDSPITLSQAGTLTEILDQYDKTTIHELTLIGPLNSTDIQAINSLPNLSVLDMEQANLTILPSNAFENNQTLTTIKLPQTLTGIGQQAFNGCSKLSSITIPDGVTTILRAAFSGCSSLTRLTLPKSLTGIDIMTFSGCSGLTSITLPEELQTIGYEAFSNCSSLGSLTIPASVTEIGDYVFYNCSSLTSVYCKPTTPPTLELQPMPDNNHTFTLYVPTNCAEAYRTAPGWNELTFKEIIETEF